MRTFLLVGLLIAIAGCFPPPQPAAGPDADLREAASAVKEKKFQQATTLYKKVISDAPQSELAKEALFQIAYLYTFHDNPRRDYVQAWKGFDEYLKRYPDGDKSLDAENWRNTLKTVIDLRKENEHLKTSIEELKKLDIRHEEKRGRK